MLNISHFLKWEVLIFRISFAGSKLGTSLNRIINSLQETTFLINLFEWSHFRISRCSLKVRTTQSNIINSTRRKYCSVDFTLGFYIVIIIPVLGHYTM